MAAAVVMKGEEFPAGEAGTWSFSLFAICLFAAALKRMAAAVVMKGEEFPAGEAGAARTASSSASFSSCPLCFSVLFAAALKRIAAAAVMNGEEFLPLGEVWACVSASRSSWDAFSL